MKNLAFKLPEPGEIKIRGYAGSLINYTIGNQYDDESTWKLLVDQFRLCYDIDNGWRGEFWGKMMRGACLTFRATNNARLYNEIVKTIKDMLSVKEKSCRISSYPIDKEFLGWDMWSRKYVMLGFIYFLDICKSDRLKEEVITALKGCADYILAHVGEGKEKGIFDTSQIYGGLNSCSILEPFVRLYEITGEKRYLDFSKYIVELGFCSDMNIIELCLNKKLYPYQFTHTKAYEMMSCFEGLLEYYKVTGEKKYLAAVENFVDMVVKTDYTIIGCSGCTHELFDNSTEKQTEETDGVMQETCVTVTFMKLAAKLFLLTGKAKYAEIIERSGLNALFGAVNDENQTMKKAEGRKWIGDDLVLVEHEPFPFDSYSTLTKGKRGRRVAGFRELQNGRSYGCCAAIGGAGTAIFGLSAITKRKNGFSVNLYTDFELKTEYKGDKILIKTSANPYGKSGAKINIDGKGKMFKLALRVPSYAKVFDIAINGEKLQHKSVNGYVSIERVWQNDVISLFWKAPLKAIYKNGKIAFKKGAVVLARDERFGDIGVSVYKDVKKNFKGSEIPYKMFKNDLFKCNLSLKVAVGKNEIALVDYSSAGKKYDDENCNIAVWQK